MADKPAPMSSAEFRTLREACGLTRVEANDLLGMNSAKAIGIQQWEAGTRSVSSEGASHIRYLDGLIRERVDSIARPLLSITDPGTVRLTRYRTREAYEAGEPEHVAAGLPFACWPATLARLTDGLARLRIKYVISWDDAVVDATEADSEAA